MASPASRQELIDYAKRQLGAPVLEINVADEQVDDIIDDSLQYFYERHFDGVIQTFLKYEVTQEDIDRARATTGGVGVATTSAEIVQEETSTSLKLATTFKFHHKF